MNDLLERVKGRFDKFGPKRWTVQCPIAADLGELVTHHDGMRILVWFDRQGEAKYNRTRKLTCRPSVHGSPITHLQEISTEGQKQQVYSILLQTHCCSIDSTHTHIMYSVHTKRERRAVTVKMKVELTQSLDWIHIKLDFTVKLPPGRRAIDDGRPLSLLCFPFLIGCYIGWNEISYTGEGHC